MSEYASLVGLRVVVADDGRIARLYALRILRDAGCIIVGDADDGTGAVQLCREHRPDLAIFDISMPRLSGLLAAQIVRRENLVRWIAMASSSTQAGLVKQVHALGAGFVGKPYKDQQLLAAVAGIVEADRVAQ